MTKLNALLFRFLPDDAHYGSFENATRELADAGDASKKDLAGFACCLKNYAYF